MAEEKVKSEDNDMLRKVAKNIKAPAATKKDEKPSDTSDLLAQAAIAIAPTIIGAAFGGTKGAAIGAQAGQTGVSKYQDIEKETRKEKKEAKKEAILTDRFERGQKQRDYVAETGRKGYELRSQKLEMDKKARITKLRKERTSHPTTKNTLKVTEAFNRIQESAKDPSPAGDLALIFNYMKMLDPGSVVRESEFRAAAQAGSLPERAQAAYNKIAAGERLSEKMRGDFVNRSGRLLKAQMQAQKPVDETYRRISKKKGFDPADVLIDFSSPEMADEVILMQAEQQKPVSMGVDKAQAVDRPELQDPVSRKRYLEELRRRAAEKRTASQRPIMK